MKLKDKLRKYQGKYFKGNEVNHSDTYVFIRKIIQFNTGFHKSQLLTYSDVIFFEDEEAVFEHNRQWYFGEYYINTYEYKRISKSEFDSVLNKYKFNKPKKGDKSESCSSSTIKG